MLQKVCRAVTLTDAVASAYAVTTSIRSFAAVQADFTISSPTAHCPWLGRRSDGSPRWLGYYFHVKKGQQLIADEEGDELPDDEQARAAAIQAVRELVPRRSRRAVIRNLMPASWRTNTDASPFCRSRKLSPVACATPGSQGLKTARGLLGR
jgi:hypothetical protein